MKIYSLIIAAIVAAELIYWVSSFRTKRGWEIVISLMSFAICIVLVCDIDANLMEMLDLEEQWPVVGKTATAIVISRGPVYLCKVIGLMAITDIFNPKDKKDEKE